MSMQTALKKARKLVKKMENDKQEMKGKNSMKIYYEDQEFPSEPEGALILVLKRLNQEK